MRTRVNLNRLWVLLAGLLWLRVRRLHCIATAILIRQPVVNRSSHFVHQAFPAAEIPGFDWRMKDHGYGPRLDGKSGFRHHVVRARDRDRYNGHSAFHRQIKWPLLERQQLAVEGALAFYKNRHVEALSYDFLRRPHGGDAGVAI